MTALLDSCTHQLIDTIRSTRRVQRARVPSGVRISALYSQMQKVGYSKKTFLDTLAEGIASQSILVVAVHVRFGSQRSNFTDVIITPQLIKPWLDVEYDHLVTGYDGSYINIPSRLHPVHRRPRLRFDVDHDDYSEMYAYV